MKEIRLQKNFQMFWALVCLGFFKFYLGGFVARFFLGVDLV